MFDAMIASALKKLLNTQSTFRKRASVEEQRAQKHDRFLRGRQIANIMYEYFRATGAYEAVQGLADLFTMSLQNDEVQDFDVTWDHAPLTVSEMPSEIVLEGWYKSKLQYSVQFQTVLALYDRETVRNNGQTSYVRLKTSAKLHIDQMILEGLYKSKFQNSVQLRTVVALYDQEVARNNGTPNDQQLKTSMKIHNDQMMRNRNFRVRADVVNEDQLPRVKKDTMPALRGKWESVLSGKHMDNVPKEILVVSVMTSKTGNKGKGERRKGRSSSPASHSKAIQTDGEEHKSSHKSEISCRVKFCKNPSYGLWHPPVCLKYMSEKGCSMATNAVSDMLRQTESPTRSRRKVVRKDQLRC